ncbi:MAG: alpha/beta hydrolase [Cyclobacteriaceae bacterium]|nr:alpha/beta hydrolase [Cyclobacteriaceae bacterium]
MRKALRLILLLTLLALQLACSHKESTSDFTDPETSEKDADFRKTVSTGSFVKLSAGYTYYEFENKSADTLLVMVHGFSVPAYIWDSTYHAAVSRGYGALRFDVYGRGYSDNPDVVYDVALYTQQLKDLLDALNITQKINLMGLSYGGRTLSAFAFQYPERIQKLIYVDPAGFETITEMPDYPVMVSEEEIKAFKQSESYSTMAQGQLSDFYDPTPFTGWDKKYETMMKFKGFVRALLSTRKNSPSLEAEQKQIALSGIPVYCFWGAHDTVVKLDDVRANLNDRLPNAQLFVIPNAGHLPHMEQATEFNSILFNRIVKLN